MTVANSDPQKGYALRLAPALYEHLQDQASLLGTSMNTHLHQLLAGASGYASGSAGDPKAEALDGRTTHTEAEAFLVVSQLSYRADVTRHSPPTLDKIRKLYRGGDRLSDERAGEVRAWTDRRIMQAAARYLRDEW